MDHFRHWEVGAVAREDIGSNLVRRAESSGSTLHKYWVFAGRNEHPKLDAAKQIERKRTQRGEREGSHLSVTKPSKSCTATAACLLGTKKQKEDMPWIY